jgi:hypothetical protein
LLQEEEKKEKRGRPKLRGMRRFRKNEQVTHTNLKGDGTRGQKWIL